MTVRAARGRAVLGALSLLATLAAPPRLGRPRRWRVRPQLLRRAYLAPSKYGHVKLLIKPYPKLRTRLAILAWTWIDELNEFDRERLLAFYKAHIDRGPENDRGRLSRAGPASCPTPSNGLAQ